MDRMDDSEILLSPQHLFDIGEFLQVCKTLARALERCRAQVHAETDAAIQAIDQLLTDLENLDMVGRAIVEMLKTRQRVWDESESATRDIITLARALKRNWGIYVSSNHQAITGVREVVQLLVLALKRWCEPVGFRMFYTLLLPPDDVRETYGEIHVDSHRMTFSEAVARIRTSGLRAHEYGKARLVLSFDKDGTKLIPPTYTFTRLIDSEIRVFGRVAKIEWSDRKSKTDLTPLLEEKRLEFVGQLDVVRALVDLYNGTYAKKIRPLNSGGEWTYPICVNEVGEGKSTLGEHFLDLVKECGGAPTLILPVLERVVYVPISLNQVTRDFDENCFIDLASGSLAKLMKDPSMLDEIPTDNVCEFFNTLSVRSGRGFFLVIDEVQAPFLEADEDSLSTQELQLYRFESFIGKIIAPLVKSSAEVFVLLMGRAPFLDWVGSTPNAKRLTTLPNSIQAQRISLNLIRPDMIVTILQ